MRRTIEAALFLVALVLLFVPIPANARMSPEAKMHIENEVIVEINRERALVGAPPLVWNPELQQATIYQTDDMIASGWFSHTSRNGLRVQDRTRIAGYNWRFVGEVLGLNQNDPRDVVNWWMNSPAHKKAILKPEFRDIGVTVETDHRGWTWWTVDLGRHK